MHTIGLVNIMSPVRWQATSRISGGLSIKNKFKEILIKIQVFPGIHNCV